MASHGAPQHVGEVIDLVSDDDRATQGRASHEPEDPFVVGPDFATMDFNAWMDMAVPPAGRAQSEGQDYAVGPAPPAPQEPALGGAYVDVDGELVFIPDEEQPQVLLQEVVADPVNADTVRDRQLALALAHGPAGVEVNAAQDQEFDATTESGNVTADACLQRVLSIFPDISHEYVFTLYNSFEAGGDFEVLPGQARLDNIIEQLVSNPTYPKQEKGKKPLKRKRADSDEDDNIKKWEQADRIPVPHYLKGPMQAMLKAEFGEIPVQYINDTLAEQKHLYQAFIALAKAQDEQDSTKRPYGKGRPSTKAALADANVIAANCGCPELMTELNAARLRVQVMRAEKAAENAKKQAEKDNLDRAIAAGETAECSACFDDLPMNRQIHCDGPIAHFVCFDCALNYIKSEVGQSRCRVLCTAGCGAGFACAQLNLLEDKELLEKLAQLQQEKDIRDAGLDDLEECPFCDYKAILPPIDEDFEFRCANPECEKVSCRRCKAISHIPISCEQYAKDNKINSRHKIEEAMTAALIRKCNKCSKSFIKDYGCNKMACQSCGNLQCYVCSQTINNYNHFDQAPQGARAGAGASKSKLCPLYDNVEERHEREVKEAEAVARAQVVKENPDVSAEDLEIKVSDAVKKSTAAHARQAGGGYMGAAAGFVGGLLPGVFGGGPRVRHDEDHDEEAEGGFGDALEVMGGLVDNNPPNAQRILDAQRARRYAIMQADLEVERERLRAEAHQREAERMAHQHRGRAQIRAERAAVPAHLQGFIPVLGFQQAQPAVWGGFPNGPPLLPQAPQHAGFNLHFNQSANPNGGWMGFGDLAQPQQQQQPADPAPATGNNANNNPFPVLNAAPRDIPRPPAFQPVHHLPGAYPPPLQLQPQHFYPAQQQQLQNPPPPPPPPEVVGRQQFNHLERLRERHDEQVVARNAAREQALVNERAREVQHRALQQHQRQLHEMRALQALQEQVRQLRHARREGQ